MKDMKIMKRLTSKPKSVFTTKDTKKKTKICHRLTQMNTDEERFYHEDHEGHEGKTNMAW